MKKETISVRIDEGTKKEAQNILNEEYHLKLKYQRVTTK